MSVIAVSDLHIEGPQDPLYGSLLELLRTRVADGDTLVLVGDVFDLFVGHQPVFLEKYHDFIAELNAAAARGAEIHYIEGNHDFLLRQAFVAPGAGKGSIIVHPREVAFTVQDRKFFFAHGDLVDRTDYGYRALRLFFRSPLIRAFVAFAPGNWVDSFGRASSHQSRKRAPRAPDALPLDRRARLRKLYRSYAAEKLGQGFDFVVMGHCHDLDEMTFQIGGRSGQYVNVGYPRLHGSFLSWSPGDERIQREKLPVGRDGASGAP